MFIILAQPRGALFSICDNCRFVNAAVVQNASIIATRHAGRSGSGGTVCVSSTYGILCSPPTGRLQKSVACFKWRSGVSCDESCLEPELSRRMLYSFSMVGRMLSVLFSVLRSAPGRITCAFCSSRPEDSVVKQDPNKCVETSPDGQTSIDCAMV